MVVFWAEHKSNQFECRLPFPLTARTWQSSSLMDRDVILGCWKLCPAISQSPIPSTTLFDHTLNTHLHITEKEEDNKLLMPLWVH